MVQRENSGGFLQSGLIMETVRNEHRHILALFDLYLSTPADSRRAIVDEILRQLTLHLEWEEAQLYAPLRQTGQPGKQLVEEALLEHEDITAMICEIQKSETDDDQALDEFFEDMMHTVRTHFDMEEHHLLPPEAALLIRQPDRP